MQHSLEAFRLTNLLPQDGDPVIILAMVRDLAKEHQFPYVFKPLSEALLRLLEDKAVAIQVKAAVRTMSPGQVLRLLQKLSNCNPQSSEFPRLVGKFSQAILATC